MYSLLLIFHSYFRWFVLISLIYAVFRGFKGWVKNTPFEKKDNFLRHTTATFSHIQLTLGYFLYFHSPLIKAFRSSFSSGISHSELRFFGLIHPILMTLAIVFITIGSALAKIKENDKDKFKTMAIYFLIALLIIFISIPWSFSPFANRPYVRSF